MTEIIGDNIRKLRESLGINQLSIARFLGVDQSLISKVENGERSLSADMLYKLACLFGVSVETIESDEMKVSDLSSAFRSKNFPLKIWKLSVLLTVLLLIPNIWQSF